MTQIPTPDDRPHFSIGRLSSGHWLVIAYTLLVLGFIIVAFTIGSGG
ncbi:MAG: hypothetical protein IPM46_10805 [Flavobacteriales bacterium]|nr:hypothetical protein [Flavobacteriales bacterium]